MKDCWDGATDPLIVSDVEADVFEPVVEWIYTKKLSTCFTTPVEDGNGFSWTRMENAYWAADMLLIVEMQNDIMDAMIVEGEQCAPEAWLLTLDRIAALQLLHTHYYKYAMKKFVRALMRRQIPGLGNLQKFTKENFDDNMARDILFYIGNWLDQEWSSTGYHDLCQFHEHENGQLCAKGW